MNIGGKYSREGLKTIGEMKVTKKQRAITRQYRHRFKDILSYFFQLFDLVDYNKLPRCCTIKHVPLVRKNGIVQRMKKKSIAMDVAVMKKFDISDIIITCSR